jgi:4-amino-4-deoxy-L-arabinose transferase-like glycosyltransferase
MATQRPGQEVLWGDEGTYVAMTASLARDFDLSFDSVDREWALERVPEKGAAVILQRVPGGVTYSKPPLYPMLAAPAYLVFGERGMLLINLLGLGFGLLLAWVYLDRVAGPGHGSLMLAVLVGASVMLPYVLWRMSEAVQIGLALGGTVLICGAMTRRHPECSGRWSHWLEHRHAPAIGGALLGLMISMRFSNAALLGGAVLACILMRRWRRVVMATGAAVVALTAVLLVTYLALGTASPYTAERTSFNAGIGYPTGDDSAESVAAEERFDARPARHRLGLSVGVETAFSTYYFIAGRHTGLLAYFPLALVMFWMLASRRDKLALGVLAGVTVLAAFYLLYTPNNYFGGSTFLGNRYFLVAYPVMIVGLRRLPSPRVLLAIATLALGFGLSAAVSTHRTQDLPGASQSHTTAGLFRSLPYESTAVDVQGHRGRFWSRDYLRFTDPYAAVRTGHFTLRSDQPAAEIMVASRLPRETITLLVRGGGGTLEWSDWTDSGSLEIPAGEGEPPATLKFTPSRPWRRHTFWFQNEDEYDVRLVRFKLDRSGIRT